MASSRHGTSPGEGASTPDIGKSKVVFLDLEATGLHFQTEILQISAVHDEEVFDTYVLPQGQIPARISVMLHITMVNDILHHQGNPKDAKPLQEALVAFLEFLEKFDSVVLVAHNAHGFDARVIIQAMKKHDFIVRFSNTVTGFADTLSMAREKFAGRLEKFDLSYLVTNLCGVTYDAHNALSDVKALQRLYRHMKPSPDEVHTNFRDVEFTLGKLPQDERQASFQDIIEAKIISTAIARSAAVAGLSYGDLRRAWDRQGMDGVRLVLRDITDFKKFKIIQNRSVMSKLQMHFRLRDLGK